MLNDRMVNIIVVMCIFEAPLLPVDKENISLFLVIFYNRIGQRDSGSIAKDVLSRFGRAVYRVLHI